MKTIYKYTYISWIWQKVFKPDLGWNRKLCKIYKEVELVL